MLHELNYNHLHINVAKVFLFLSYDTRICITISEKSEYRYTRESNPVHTKKIYTNFSLIKNNS